MGLFQTGVPSRLQRSTLTAAIGSLVALAWLALWLTGASAHSLFHLQHGLGHTPGRGVPVVLLFVGGWTVMSVAMMLPASLPILTTFHTLARDRADRSMLVALVVAGYLGTWAAFGALVYGGSVGAQWLAATPFARPYGRAGAPALLVLAGLFQFSSLKYRCLDKCRSPLSFVLSHWQGTAHRSQAFRLGVHHGLFCVGCCWALMLLMFVAGVGYLGWMLVLGLVMAVEKNMPWGRRISAPVGVVLLAWAAALLAGGS